MGVLWDDDPLAWERQEANAVRATTDYPDLPPPERDTPTRAEAERDERES